MALARQRGGHEHIGHHALKPRSTSFNISSRRPGSFRRDSSLDIEHPVVVLLLVHPVVVLLHVEHPVAVPRHDEMLGPVVVLLHDEMPGRPAVVHERLQKIHVLDPAVDVPFQVVAEGAAVVLRVVLEVG